MKMFDLDLENKRNSPKVMHSVQVSGYQTQSLRCEVDEFGMLSLGDGFNGLACVYKEESMDLPITHPYRACSTPPPEMPKSKKKSNSGVFQKGNVPFNKGISTQVDDIEDTPTESAGKWKRLPQDLYDDVVQPSSKNSSQQFHDSYGRPTQSKLLRPSSTSTSRQQDIEKDDDGVPPDALTHRLLHLQKTEDLWNEAINGHRSCTGRLKWDIKSEIQRGLGWRMRIICAEGCGYHSNMHNLYEEVETASPHRGPKAVAANIGIQIGLTHSMVSNTAFRNVLMAANVPPPSARVMQQTANKVCDAITVLNEQDMAKQREHLRDVNEGRGLPRDAPIRAEGDGRYNNPLRSGAGNTPFQPATQSTYTIIENSTEKKKIISVQTANKLCSKRKGYDTEHKHMAAKQQ